MRIRIPAKLMYFLLGSGIGIMCLVSAFVLVAYDYGMNHGKKWLKCDIVSHELSANNEHVICDITVLSKRDGYIYVISIHDKSTSFISPNESHQKITANIPLTLRKIEAPVGSTIAIAVTQTTIPIDVAADYTEALKLHFTGEMPPPYEALSSELYFVLAEHGHRWAGIGELQVK